MTPSVTFLTSAGRLAINSSKMTSTIHHNVSIMPAIAHSNGGPALGCFVIYNMISPSSTRTLIALGATMELFRLSSLIIKAPYLTTINK